MSGRRGSILILVLFVLMVLSLVGVSFAYRAGLENRSANHRVINIQLRNQAASAVAVAMSRLVENVNEFDHRAEPWHTHRPIVVEGWLDVWERDLNGQPADFVTEYQVIDEQGKVNILYASSEALETLGMTESQIACLFDWMDDDDVERAEGAEDGFYLSGPKPYKCKNAPLEVLEELLAIKGISYADYLGEDLNHNRQLDASEDDGGVSMPNDDADGRLKLGWVDLLTCFGDGRINLNTAPVQVLETLPLSDGAVDQIVGFRSFDADSSGELEEHVFTSAEDIGQLQGLTDADVAVLEANSVFISTHFRIFVQSKHITTGLDYRLCVVVGITEAGLEVLQWQPGL